MPILSNTSMVCPVKKSRSFDGTTKTHSGALNQYDDIVTDDTYSKHDRRKHNLRTELFDTLAEHFPSDMTHPKGNLIDLIPHPVDLN